MKIEKITPDIASFYLILNKVFYSVIEEIGIKDNQIITKAIVLFIANFIGSNSSNVMIAADSLFDNVKFILSQVESLNINSNISEDEKLH